MYSIHDKNRRQFKRRNIDKPILKPYLDPDDAL